MATKSTVIQSTFTPNACQQKAIPLLAGPARYVLLMGGGGSGKSTFIAWAIINRAMNSPGSRHLVFRETSASCRITMFDKTFKDVLRIGWPGLIDNPQQCRINETEMTIEFPALGSIIIFGGLQEANIDRILGQEAATIFLNEATDLTFKHFNRVNNRLRQKAFLTDGRRLPNKLIMDCNPTDQNCFLYHLFDQHQHPETKQPLKSPQQYVSLKLLPHSNKGNLDEAYFEAQEDASADDYRRFVLGEWKLTVDGAMFQHEWIADHRLNIELRNDLRDSLSRIVVAIDPAASSNEGSDETGIIVAGVDEAGHGYILDDLSGRYTPTEWASIATEAYREWGADKIVAERNNGGEMVESTIRNVDRGVAVTTVWASRGKETRAAPAATHYEKGRVHHVGIFTELESQMVSFVVGFNRRKHKSPDRLDALVWALEDLMVMEKPRPAIVTSARAGGFFGV
jgi:predicted phage terminase large subunit-like protein